ncbi:MAG: hypothetical protein QF632_00775 [Candidatus Woesearchaeota archaeon]|jgi:predicted Zn-dependent protease|nr:hypothetical protein [Candidatus Woesearchaeota archaeon]MDP7323274.1 hypothetical protein [Candidatus Woesearchaeota archaeon]MDP7458243.1 hypothetical protein [Candidatus Woesearchaeota archaeon]
MSRKLFICPIFSEISPRVLDELAAALGERINNGTQVYHAIGVEDPIEVPPDLEEEITTDFDERGTALRLGSMGGDDIGLLDYVMKHLPQTETRKHILCVTDRNLVRYDYGWANKPHTFVNGECLWQPGVAILTNHYISQEEHPDQLRLVLAMHETGHLRRIEKHCDTPVNGAYCAMASRGSLQDQDIVQPTLQNLADKYCDTCKAKIVDFELNNF